MNFKELKRECPLRTDDGRCKANTELIASVCSSFIRPHHIHTRKCSEEEHCPIVYWIKACLKDKDLLQDLIQAMSLIL